MNILIDPTVLGKVNVDLTDVDWETALKGVLRMHNYSYEWVGKDMVVVTKQKEGEQVDTAVYTFEHANVEELEKMKTLEKMLTPQGKITYDRRTNTVWVIDTRPNLVRIEGVFDTFDVPSQQVSIEAKVLETDVDLMHKLGIDWNMEISASGSKRPHTWPFGNLKGNIFPGQFPTPPSSAFTFGVLDASTLKATLRVIFNDNDTKILSMPKITTVANNTATIDVVTEDPVPNYTYNAETGQWEISGFEWKKYGVTLKVTPQINKEGFVTLVVKPTVSDKIGETEFESSGASGAVATIPILSTQTTETKVVVKDKETLVIGGLIRDKSFEKINKLPVLGNIPYLGYLFKHKHTEVKRVNLLIFITPRIVNQRNLKVAAAETAEKKETKQEESSVTPKVDSNSSPTEITASLPVVDNTSNSQKDTVSSTAR